MRRIAGAVVALLLAAPPATGQHDGDASQPNVTAKPAARLSDATPPKRGEGAVRLAAAAAPKRATTPPAPARDAAIPLAERIAIQFDLAWTGDYNGLVNGEFNDKTTAAIKTFQRDRNSRKPAPSIRRSALCSPPQRRRKRPKSAGGWSTTPSAARLSACRPGRCRTRAGAAAAPAGPRAGQVQVETFKIREPGTTLAAVYEQQKKEPLTRRLEVNLLRPDFFILSGMQNLKRFYVRAEIKDGEVRGMTVLYDQAMEPIMDPVVVVMSSTFMPFPGVAGIAQIGAAPKRKVEYGTGIVVSAAGRSHRPPGDRGLQRDRGGRIRRCRPPGGGHEGRPRAVAGFRRARSRARELRRRRSKGPDLTLVGIADPQAQGGGGTISTRSAKLRGDTLEPRAAARLFRRRRARSPGRVVGMVGLKTAVTADAGATGGPPQAALVPAPIIRAFLQAQKLAPVAAERGGVDAVQASLVRVICVRK